MRLSAGEKLGPYEIIALIGKGGMGEVFHAHDTKLKRDVALKVLPESFDADPGRMARFQREAEVLASLNHPNIAHIYSVEERALAMELVEGESPKGPMPFEDAWKIMMQIADALEYAHERGVIHRDLKPANVKVTPDGVVKLLDFGLAKAFSDQEDAASGDPSNSPTVTLGATVAGTIMGTAAYMAPEQARGKRVDKRADIWSWGVVLYELLTGQRMFQGEDAADTLAAVIHKQPELELVPVTVRRLLGECLKKDPKQRLRDIGDAKRLLDEESARTPRPRIRLEWIVAAALLAASAALGLVAWKHFREAPPQVARLFFPLPSETFEPAVPHSTAVSPDGRRIAYAGVVNGQRQVWVRELDEPVSQLLVAEGGSGWPFWAPDSRRLGFFADGKLKKLDVTGGPAVTIADAQATTGGLGPWSGSWNQDDVIIFSRLTSPLFRVSAAGGTPTPLTQLDAARQESAHFAPWFLPDGRHFLYAAVSDVNPQTRSVYVGDLTSKTRKQVLKESTVTIYVAPGYLLFGRDGTLMAQPFDASKLETTGEAVPVGEQADVTTAGVGVAMGYFSASQNGILVYTSGREPTGVQLTWLDRAGKRLGTVGQPADIPTFSLSPEGARVAFMRRDLQAGRYELWTRDLARGTESRLTSNGANSYAAWSADGTQIFYGSRVPGKIYRRAADNTGSEEVIDTGVKTPWDVSRDGRYLFTVANPVATVSGGLALGGKNEIWVLPLFGDRKPFPFLKSEFRESQPKLSPDGRWLAYQSDESKRNEIYVVSFPQPNAKLQISTEGGRNPVWSHDGRELYYYSNDNKVMAVEVKLAVPGSRPQFGVPKVLFEAHTRFNNGIGTFDVSRDGRFLLPVVVEQTAVPMTVVLNWPETLKEMMLKRR